MTNLTESVQSLVAAGLISKFSRDLASFAMEPSDKVSIWQIVEAANQCGVGYHHLAGAYFVECAFEDSSSLRDQFDEEIQNHIGDDYALAFITELARLNTLRVPHQPN